MAETRTIRISETNAKWLENEGKKGETFDEIMTAIREELVEFRKLKRKNRQEKQGEEMQK